MIRVELKPSLKKDVDSVCGGLYRMNAPYANAYFFLPNKNGKSIEWGEFGRITEKDFNEWPYMVDLVTGIAYRLEEKDCPIINQEA